MKESFAEAFFGACFALVGWLVLSITRLTIAVNDLRRDIKPLTQDIPKMKKDIDALHVKTRGIH